MSGDEYKKTIKRRRGNTLEKWEVALVKAMFPRGGLLTNDQDILAYFTRPTRSINHRLIGEIRNEIKHKGIKPASDADLDTFLASWPNIDPETGLSVHGDELLIKSREAMIAAVQIFNGAGLLFRSELFIVTAIIAWTYLLHAWFKREGTKYHYDTKTRNGAVKFWDLSKCLEQTNSIIGDGVRDNLNFLLEIRHEIEHRSTNRIDDALGSKLQACAINFNNVLKREFGAQYGLEKKLPLALQFVTFDLEQQSALKKVFGLPQHIEASIKNFEANLTEDQFHDTAYRMSYAFVPIAGRNKNTTDRAIEFIRPGTEEAKEIEKIVLKPTSHPRYIASKVVEVVQKKGFPRFKVHHHTKLWKEMNIQRNNSEYCSRGDYKDSWVWNDKWIALVVKHCNELSDEYR